MMATGRLFGDGRNRGHRRADTKGPGGLVIGAVALLSASLVVAGGFAYADAPVPTPIETSSVITDAPSSPVPITSETQAPTALPSATPSEPAVQPSTPSVPVVQPSVDTSKDPVAKFPTTLAEDADGGVAPLALGPETGVSGPYLHWTVKDAAGAPVGGATVTLQGPRGSFSSWGTEYDVVDCVEADCQGPDLDPDPGEFQVNKIGTHTIQASRRYRLTDTVQAPVGFQNASVSREIPGTGQNPTVNPWTTHDFGQITLSPVPTFNWTVTVKKATYRTGLGTNDVNAEHTAGVRFGMFDSSTATTPSATCEIAPSNLGNCVFNVTRGNDQRNVVIKEIAPALGSVAATKLGPPLTTLTTGGDSYTDRDYKIDLTLPQNGGSMTVPASGSGWSENSGRVANRAANPLLAQSCNAGVKVALVMDLSGSVEGYQNNLAKAATALVDGLTGTPSSVALFSFSTGSPATKWDGGNTNTVLLANRPTPQSVQTTTGANTVKGWYSTNNGQTANFTPSGGTNWDAGLWTTAQGAVQHDYDVVFVLTDGNPTFSGDREGSGSLTTLRELERAVYSANAIKKTGARVVTVGVGGNLSDHNLSAIAGPSKYAAGDSLNEFDYTTADWAQLESVLRNFAQGLKCEATVTVEKQAKPYGGSYAAASGWNFGLSQTGAASQAPTGAQSTGPNGQTSWTLKFSTPDQQANVVLTENENRAGWNLADIECDTGDAVINLGSKQASLTGIGIGSNVKCTFKNEQKLTGALKITKAFGDTSASGFGSGVQFTGGYACTLAGSSVASGTWSRTGGGDAVLTAAAGSPAPNQIPANASCSVTENAPSGGLPNSSWEWTAPTIGAPVTITNGATATLTVTNHVKRVYGNFQVTKVLAPGSSADSSLTYSGNWQCTLGQESITGTWGPIAAGGVWSSTDASKIPLGAACSVTSENRPQWPVANDHSYQWNGNPTFSAPVAAAKPDLAKVTVTNATKRVLGQVSWNKVDATTSTLLGGSAWTITGPGHQGGTVVDDCIAGPCTGADQDPVAGSFLLKDLLWGTYTVAETQAPQGYLGGLTFTFTVDAANAATGITLGDKANERKTGSVIWTKVDSDNNDAPLPGSTWTVTGPGATDGVKITDCTAGPCGTGPFDDRDPAPGKFRVDGLIWGDYTFEETGAPEGYEGNASFDVTINAAAVHNGVVNMGNQPNKRMTGTVAWSKTDADGNLLGGSVWTLKGTGLAADPVIVDCTAATCPEGPYLDQDPAAGKFLLMGLPWASYTLTETKPPLGYTGGAEFTFTVDATSVQDLVNGGEHKNVRKTGSVIWNKVDELSKPLGGSQWRIIGPGHPAPGTVFADCTAAGCTGLDRNPAPGEFELVGLEWGSYTISEAAPPVGHTGTHTFHVEITAANAGQVLGNGSFVNKRKLGAVEWSKVDDLDKSLLGGSEWTLTGPGAAGGIVVVDCTEPTCATGPFTDQDPDAGEFRVEGLVWGAYTAVETGNPQGFTGSRDFAFVVDAEKSEATQEFGPFDNTRIPGAVAWNKVDADGGALLGGSEWIITGGDITPTVIVDCVESPCATDPLTDQDPAVGQFALAGLPWGTYTVTESKSPEGYTGVAEFSFTVAADTVEGGERTFGPFTNSKQAGGVSWQKVDSEDGNHLAGSAWTVTGPGIDGIVVADCVEATCPADPFTDQNANPGEFLLEGLPWGTYTITETTVPTGYEGDASFTVTIDASNAGTVIGMVEQENKRKPGLVTWTKVDAENDTLLAGSVWKITGPGAPDGETVIDCVAAGCATGEFTDVDPVAGQFKLEGLAWGTYTVEETVTPEGYTDKKSFTFEVTAENAGTAIVIEAQKNERKPGAVIWRKTDAVGGGLLAGSTWTLTGPGVPADTVVVDCVEADCAEGAFPDQDPTPGGFKLAALAWGDYTLTEKDAPGGYVASATPLTFSVDATTVDTAIDLGAVANERIPGTVIWTKVAKGSADALAGAEWSLTGPGHPSGTAVTDCIGDCAGLLDQDPTAGGFKLTDLDWGTYTLVETKAPPGYRLDATPHQFVIGVDGEASLEIDLQQIENVQRTGPVLPLTGGIGRDQIVLAGAFVLLLALLAFAGRRLRIPRSA